MSDSERREQQARYYDDAAKAGPGSPFPGHAHTARMLREMTTIEAEAFRRGAEAMREAAAQWHDMMAATCLPGTGGIARNQWMAERIRALPLPAPRPEPTGLEYRGG